MFSWINKQGVKSSKGYIVQSVARFVIEYREAGKCISIEVESDYAPGMKPYEKVKSYNFEKWDDGTLISSEQQKEILKNFTEAMEFQGIGVIVE
jgi:hypothetical protein